MSSKIQTTRAEGDFPQDDWRAHALRQVRTLYVSFVQGLFSAAPAGSYRWHPVPHETEIYITDENVIHGDVVGKRPAVNFTRGPVQSNTLGHDDLLDYKFETGQKKKSVLISGIMNVNVCSRIDVESEDLAWLIAEQLWMHREMLMKAGFFEIGRQFVVGAPSPAGSLVVADSADEWYATTASLPFQFHRTSVFTPLNKEIVDQIGFTLRARGMTFLSKGPVTGHKVDTSAPGVEEHKVPHPLNPAKQVVIRPAHPYRAGLRPPSMGGRVLPIQRGTVEQSDAPVTAVTSTSFKV
jgi:hypothetical protein